MSLYYGFRAEEDNGDLRILVLNEFELPSVCGGVSRLTLNVDICTCYCSNLSFNDYLEALLAVVLSVTDRVIYR